jgi:hypothetical protein
MDVAKRALGQTVRRSTVLRDSAAAAGQLNGSHDNNQKRGDDHWEQIPNVDDQNAFLEDRDGEWRTHEIQFTVLWRVNKNRAIAMRRRPRKWGDFQGQIVSAIGDWNFAVLTAARTVERTFPMGFHHTAILIQ